MDEARRRGRQVLMLIAALFLLPVLVASLLYYGKLWRPACPWGCGGRSMTEYGAHGGLEPEEDEERGGGEYRQTFDQGAGLLQQLLKNTRPSDGLIESSALHEIDR